MTQERMTDADRAKVTAKKEAKNRQMQTNTRLMKKKSEKTCTVAINTSTSVSLRHLENLTSGNYGGNSEGGVLCGNLLSIYSQLNRIDPSTNIFPPNPERGYRTKFEILLEEVFPKSIE